MTPKQEKTLQARLEILEVQQTVMAGFISALLQTELHHLPELQRSQMQATYANLFEKTIARLLASEIGFKDTTIRAIERLKISMLEIPVIDPKP